MLESSSPRLEDDLSIGSVSMKVCPYCQEEIHDEASRCRFCLSSFSSEAGSQTSVAMQTIGRRRVIYSVDLELIRSAKFAALVILVFIGFGVLLYLYGFGFHESDLHANQKTYIVDLGLIRFAKFAGAVLALFVTAGVFLYGYNLKEVSKEIKEMADHMRDLQRQALNTGDEIRHAMEAVAADRSQSGNFLNAIKESKGGMDRSIAEHQQQMEVLFKDGKETADRMRDLQQKTAATQDEIGKAMNAVASDRAESERLLVEMQSAQPKINKSLETLRQRMDDLYKEGREKIDTIDEALKKRGEKLANTAIDLNKPAETPGDFAAVKKVDKPSVTAPHPFTVPELARLYDFPVGLDGSGQCIGLIQLGGGYRDSDLETYFDRLKIKKPKVTWESVDGAKNSTSRGLGLDPMVTMTIQVAGAVAPGAHIVVYFAPNTQKGFLGAINKAIADERNRPTVLSIAWGASEENWTKQAMKNFDLAFQAGAAQGITIVCAAGDGGVADGLDDGKAHVDFPASSPWVLACGGTRLIASKDEIRSEVVWNQGKSGTGGGVSDVFPLPQWQSAVNVPARRNGKRGRGVPDVAAYASPEPGYSTFVHGKSIVLGGTTAVAPLWAGLIALLNQGIGRNLGYINPLLYSNIGPAGALRSMTDGSNGNRDVTGHSAPPEWIARVGWGSPNGTKLLEAFRSSLQTLVQ
jgi:Subtilase family